MNVHNIRVVIAGVERLFEFFLSFRGNSSKNSILVVVRAPWIVREVESYALSKFQPPTTLGDHQNVEKTIPEKIDFLGFRKSVFRHFSPSLCLPLCAKLIYKSYA